MSIWPIIIICGLLCTQIANPSIIFRLFKGTILSIRESLKNSREYKEAIKTAKKDKNGETANIQKGEVDYEEAFGLTTRNISGFLILQLVFFLLGGAILGVLWFYFGTMDRTFTAIFSTCWLVAIAQAINAFIVYGCNMLGLGYDELYAGNTKIYVWIMFVLSIALNIHSGVYNFCHPVEPHTYLYEEEIPVIDINVLQTLKEETIVDGYVLKSPISRSGKTIIPLSRGGNVSIVGYVLIENDKPIIVQKNLVYTPYQSVSTNVKHIARDYLPTKVFFGDWTFQLDTNGEVYFAQMYGHFASLRAGRVVEGMLLINATTGECSVYEPDKVPEWVSGISE